MAKLLYFYPNFKEFLIKKRANAYFLKFLHYFSKKKLAQSEQTNMSIAHKILFRLQLISFFLLLGVASSLAQELSTAQQNQIQKYEQEAERFRNENNQVQTAHYLNLIATIYWEANMLDTALEHFGTSLELNKSIGNQNAIWSISNNIGMIYSDMGEYERSIEMFEKSLEAAREIGRSQKIATSLINTAIAAQYKNNYEKSNEYLEEAVTIAREENDLNLLRTCYGTLAENHEKLGNAGKSLEYSNFYIAMDKLIREKEEQRERAEAQLRIARAEAARREKELELDLQNLRLQETQDSLNQVEAISKARAMENQLLRKEKELSDLKIKEQEAKMRNNQLVRNMFIGAFIFILIVLILIYIQFRHKKKANIVLAEKNQLLRKQKQEIEYQNRTLQEQKEEIEEKSHLLETANQELQKKNQQITDSIKYASRIQEAILPSKKAILESFPESFIFYKPREIVSGDFYWFSKQNGNYFIAAVDCTGHSVPGAFMSMIGNTLLNEIVNEKKTLHPASILEQLNIGVITTLNQKEDSFTQDDGMDITICRIDLQNHQIEIASANHAVYIFNGEAVQTIEGDIFSIGGTFSKEGVKFTNHVVDLKQGSTFYLLSDGYADQFGGPKNKKFMSRQLKELLANIQQKPMARQKQIVEQRFINWKGENRQIDDVLIIGIRIVDFASPKQKSPLSEEAKIETNAQQIHS